MNQHDFAVLVGKPQSTIARIEAESMNPSLGLITEIVNKAGKQVKLIIKYVENKYGSDFFEDYDVKKEPQEKWTEEYLKELEIKSMAGLSSKQFILYLSEVSDFVHEHSKKKR